MASVRLLRQQLDRSDSRSRLSQRRLGKRQAAPFSKGAPAAEPMPPGRKSGKRHGPHAHRSRPPPQIDETHDAPLPETCPGCAGRRGRETRVIAQYRTEIHNLRKHPLQWLWFLIDPSIQATNHWAETAIRPAVVNRKVWGGNSMGAGANAQSILMSVIRPC